MTSTIELEEIWDRFQITNSAPRLSVTASAISLPQRYVPISFAAMLQKGEWGTHGARKVTRVRISACGELSVGQPFFGGDLLHDGRQ